MAYASITKPSLHFNTKLYTGSGSAGHSITGVGFQPDWTWIKSRSGTHNSANHRIYDAVRGVTKVIYSNLTNAEGTDAQGLTAFGTDGFTLGTENQSNGSSTEFASWNWKANGAGSSNSDGSITSTVSANTTAGFSIVKYTGNGSLSQTVGHGLGTTPKFKIIKSLGATAEGWAVSGLWLGSTVGNRMFLNTNAALGNPSGYYALDTSTTIGISGASNNPTSQNASGQDFIAYCFAEKKGYSKIGSYVGNGNASGTFVYTGFKPAFILLKPSSASGNWFIFDSKREGFNVANDYVSPNTSGAEVTNIRLDLLSNGFKLRTSNTGWNGSGTTYIYLAFAAEPLVANVGQSIPATAR